MKKIVNLEVVTTRGWKKIVTLEVVTTRGWKKIVNLKVVTTRGWKKIVNSKVVTTRIWKKKVKVVNFVVVEGLKGWCLPVGEISPLIQRGVRGRKKGKYSFPLACLIFSHPDWLHIELHASKFGTVVFEL
jgi:hypothetical protein